MPRIRCHYIDCSFLDEGYCSAAAVEIDPNEGCMTFTPSSDIIPDDEWDEETDELEEWDELDEEEDDDLWLDDGDEDY
jgi:hypothetical protein